MSRSNYSDDGDYLELYRATVTRAINGKRGQAFLNDLAKALDEMPTKRLIMGDLVTETGEVCAIGAVCKMRGLDVSNVDVYNPREVGELVGISRSMAAEIEYENDECANSSETPEMRWERIRGWVQTNIKKSDSDKESK